MPLHNDKLLAQLFAWRGLISSSMILDDGGTMKKLHLLTVMYAARCSPIIHDA